VLLICTVYPADYGVPLVDSNLNLTYNSTLEGSVAVVLCGWFEVIAFCHKNGIWSPKLTDSVCHLQQDSVITGEKIMCTALKLMSIDYTHSK
jgi:hypothetical protein